MGANAEKQQDFGAAVRFYREALAMEPMRNDVWYFIHNNLGFSLNTLGHFTEGEQYCRNAIEIDPTRCNAHKNLGFALAGQRQHRKAAGCFVTAAQVNAADARSLRLLQEMLREHPELECEFQGDVECCKKVVELAAQKASELKPAVYRGWRKHLILWQAKLRSVGRKLRNLFHSSLTRIDRQQISPAPSLQNIPDLRVSFHGTFSLFHPLADMAHEWMGVHCPADDNRQYLHVGFVDLLSGEIIER
jgi:tetratricopeptide (TPR) repeat protein